MKARFALVLLLVVLVGFPARAEETEARLSLGGFGIGLLSVGTYADYVAAVLGGGLLAEYTPHRFGRIGVNAQLQGAASIPSSGSLIGSGSSVAALFGLHWRFSVAPNIAIQPSLGYGVWLHIVDAAADAAEPLPQDRYLDQVLQLSVAARWLVGRGEIDFAPTYTVLPERDALLQLLGLRVGALYRIR